MNARSRLPRWLFFWFMTGVSSVAAAQSPLAGQPFIRNFHSVEYNAGIQNREMVQDRRGILYIANNFGLLEYDGARWSLHPVLNGTKVRSVAIDARGRIYVGCQGDFGYFFPDAQGRLRYTSLADSLPMRYRDFDEAWSVYIDRSRVYFCTFDNIFIYEGSDITVAEAPWPIDLSFYVNRELFVTSSEAGITRLDGLTFKPVKGGEFFKTISVSSILPLHANAWLISTRQDGVFVLSDGIATPWHPSLQDVFRKLNINSSRRLRNGNIAFGTQNDGLVIVAPAGTIVSHLTTARGLANRTVLSIYEDDLDNIWIGQNNGLAYIELGSPFTFLNEQSGLPGTGYSAYLEGVTLYAATNTGLYRKSGNEPFIFIENSGGQAYHVGKYGSDLLAGHHNGAMRVEGAGAETISPAPGAWVFLSLKDHDNFLLGGGYTGLALYKKQDNHWHYVRKLPGFSESSRVMAEVEDGSIWITHGYKGVFRVTLSGSLDSVIDVRFYGTGKGFPSNHLINVFTVAGEKLFTSERGVYRYDASSDRFVRDRLFEKLFGPDAELWSVREDALGNIYFAGRSEIGVVRRNSMGGYSKEASSFNRIRRYLNDDLINITVLHNNEVLFGAKDGFIHYDPKMEIRRPQDFRTIIRNVTVTRRNDSTIFFGNFVRGDTVATKQFPGGEPVLSFDDNSVRFTFAATSYEDNSQLSYQYLLEHFDRNWSDWTPAAEKEYTNLREGRYVFKVRARNANGQVSPEDVYGFVISPPWYRSVAAYGFYGISVGVLLLSGFSFLDRKYKRKQHAMAMQQKQELHEKEHALTTLEQRSREEISRLQHEKLEAELRHMSSELGTSTMHLLNKNEFITSIKTNLQHIIRKGANEDLKRELLQITREIENNISADSDWEQFQFHFDRVHGDFSSRFKAAYPSLTPQEIKLSAYLRMNLSSKEIAHLLNISVRGVEISRYRLRKKLQLERNTNLQDFILNF